MRNIEFIQKVVDYFNENNSTVRETAKHFEISKSAVHHYLTKVLPNETSKRILARNKILGPIRGGEVTRILYTGTKRKKCLTKQKKKVNTK